LNSSEVVIIGGGAVGASIAYRLASAGMEVTLFEKGSLCSGTSGATFAWVGAHGQRPYSFYRLRCASISLYPGLSEELGYDVEYEPQGSLILLKNDSELQEAEREVAALHEEGCRIELLDRAGLMAVEPAVGAGFSGATYCPLGGSLNPFRLVYGYAMRARQMGASIYGGAEVREIKIKNRQVHSVVTDEGPIRVERVVNAAGINAPCIGRMVGLDIPVRPVRGQVLVTEPMPPVIKHIVEDVKQTPRGNLLVGRLDEEAGYDNECTIEGLNRLASSACNVLPVLKTVHFIRAYSGLRPMPADGLPILGESSEVGGFFNAVMHSGVTLSAIVGVLIAQLITEGQAEISFEPYSLHRFHH